MNNGNRNGGSRLVLFFFDNMVWVIVAVLLLWGAIFVPMFFSGVNLMNIVFHSTILAMLVLGEAICLMSGNFDLSIESTLGFTAMIAPICFVRWIPGLPWWTGMLFVLGAGALIGAINGLLVVKLGINPFLETLAMLIVLRGLNLFVLPRSIFDGIPPSYSVLGGGYLGPIPVAVIVMVVVFVFFGIMMTQRRFGRNLLAVGANANSARCAGVNAGRVTIMAFVISGFLAALAGVLLTGRLASVNNVMGEGMVFLAFAGAVMGGVSLQGGEGTVLGCLGGVLVLGIIDNALQLIQVNVWFVYALKGILIFIAIVLDNMKRQLRLRIMLRLKMRNGAETACS